MQSEPAGKQRKSLENDEVQKKTKTPVRKLEAKTKTPSRTLTPEVNRKRLPNTPQSHNERVGKLRRILSEKAVGSASSTQGRGGRTASRVASQKITKTVEKLNNLGKKMRRPSGNDSFTMTSTASATSLFSFLPSKPVVHKPSEAEIRQKREEEHKLRQQKEGEALKRREELKKAEVEKKRLEREARTKKVLEARQAQEKEQQMAKQTYEKENKEKLKALSKLCEAKALEAKQKKAENERKLLEAEERRKQEEAEKKKKDEEKKRREEAEAKRQAELERKQNEARLLREKLEREEAAKKAELEAEAKRKREEEERKREERLAKIREMGNTKLNQTQDHNTSALNSTYTKPADSTFTKENPANTTYTKDDNYDITPARHELPPEPLKDKENYDIMDLKSDDDTDDEENPRKIIPKWAHGKFSYRMSLTGTPVITDYNSLFFNCRKPIPRSFDASGLQPTGCGHDLYSDGRHSQS